MKKTLVAIAALAAATGAMAEVTISGTVDLGYTNTTLTSAAGASSVRGGVNNGINGQDALNFGVSEQLDNGLTAYANFNYAPTTDVATSPAQDSGSGVGLKGDFGNLFLGRTWDAVMTSVVFAQPNYGNIQGISTAHTGYASAWHTNIRCGYQFDRFAFDHGCHGYFACCQRRYWPHNPDCWIHPLR